MVTVRLACRYATAAVGAESLGREASYVPRVAAMFGLGIDEEREIAVVPAVELTLRAGEVVFVTGPSGSGKSTVLRLIREALAERGDVRVVDLAAVDELPDRPLVDALGQLFPAVGLEGLMRVLSLTGLNDAFVMLRRPGELSDGQRWRLRMARAVLEAQLEPASTQACAGAGGEIGAPLCVVLADEFGATLDRVTAQVIAGNVRKWVSGAKPQAWEGDGARALKCPSRGGAGVCFVAATTHEDLLEALWPDVLVAKGLGEAIEVVERGSEPASTQA